MTLEAACQLCVPGFPLGCRAQGAPCFSRPALPTFRSSGNASVTRTPDMVSVASLAQLGCLHTRQTHTTTAGHPAPPPPGGHRQPQDGWVGTEPHFSRSPGSSLQPQQLFGKGNSSPCPEPVSQVQGQLTSQGQVPKVASTYTGGEALQREKVPSAALHWPLPHHTSPEPAGWARGHTSLLCAGPLLGMTPLGALPEPLGPTG